MVQSRRYKYDENYNLTSETELGIDLKRKVACHEMGHLLGLNKTSPSDILNAHVDRTGKDDNIGDLACIDQVCITDHNNPNQIPNLANECLMSYCKYIIFESMKTEFDAACYWRLRRDVSND